MGSKFFYTAFTIMVLSASYVHSQTKVVVPTTRIEFNSISKTSFSKLQLQAIKKSDRWKKNTIQELQKILKQTTSIPNEDWRKYEIMLKGLDSLKLSKIAQDFASIKNLSAPKMQSVKNVAKELSYKHKEEVLQLLDSADQTWKYLKSSTNVSDTLSNHLTDPRLVSVMPNTDVLDSLKWKKPDIEDSEAHYKQVVGKMLEKYLEQWVSQQVAFSKLEPYQDPTNAITSPVKQYIPELEEFDFEKPEIPREKLMKALLEQQRDKKINELKKSLNVKEADESYKKSIISGFEIGGFMQYTSNPSSIELTPSLSYGFNKKFSLGVGYSTAIKINQSDSIPITEGFRAFADYVLYKAFFIHVESAWLNRKPPSPELPVYRERNTYLGLGRSFRYKFLKTSMLVLYNFDAPTPLQQKKFSFRFGLTISK